MILVIISFPVVSTLQLPPREMAQVAPSEAAKVLVDDTIQALKANDISKGQIHLNILNRQLPTFVNSILLESVKVLLDDTTHAMHCIRNGILLGCILSFTTTYFCYSVHRCFCLNDTRFSLQSSN